MNAYNQNQQSGINNSGYPSGGYPGNTDYQGNSGITGVQSYPNGTNYNGNSGYSDNSGYSGNSGYSNNSGSVGYSGNSGNSGSVGYLGNSGYSNNSGNSGYLNNSGYTSNLASPGYPGYQKKKKVKVSFNSPVVLSFALICLFALITEYLTDGFTTDLLFSVYRSSLLDPFTYVRFFGHVIGHADFEHYLGNMMYLLIVGPLLEEKYGSKSILAVMVVTAFVTGVLSYIFFPDIQLLGASGIVFAFILLSSFTSMREGEIPLTFIVVAVLYIGDQVLQGMLIEDDISNFGHILGGICGSVLGYMLNKNKLARMNSAGGNVNNNNNGGNNFTYY